ncbi:Uncharacterized protein APZ42_008939 [Daphnia magna]|uniref:Uncharacterized protein n=1 Tax=Daphnia magna TaxID=35525 RepID=A0A162CZL5_9CRUS|nr:Uncharacterized protein APZ42_008939 [Daphnia magna]
MVQAVEIHHFLVEVLYNLPLQLTALGETIPDVNEVRSIIDYSYPVILQLRSTLMNKLDTIQNTILRSILQAPCSTLRAHLWLDTGICPILCRCDWLAYHYQMKLNFKSKNPFYKNASQTYSSLTFWKPRISLEKKELRDPPWLMPKISTFFFLLSKTISTANQTRERILFRLMYTCTNNGGADENDTITVFSDGSFNPSDNTAACAIYCPKLQISKGWKLTDATRQN